MKNPVNTFSMIKAIGLLTAGILLGWLVFGGGSAQQPDIEQHVQETHTNEEGETVYTCSMHPSIRENEPGDCPICGMELIPLSEAQEESGDSLNPQALQMTEAAMKIADVQTGQVHHMPAVKQVRMPGRVSVDERNISIIPAHFPGRVEELHVNYTGAYIEKGDRLASIYSPELVTAQRELLEAYRSRSQNPALYRGARKKLENWEISEQEINEIIQAGEPKTAFDINAQQSGYVLERNVAVGDHIGFGEAMFKVADLSRVWVLFEAYESELLGLDTGGEVTFRVESLPGQEFTADVTYIDPLINESQRTVSVRTEVENKDNMLKPNMLAEGVIAATIHSGDEVLQVPKEAVMWTGERSVVYVKDTSASQPAFAAREVVLGPRAGDHYVIEDGLHEGEAVVVRGNFMIDSAAQLEDKASMMNTEPGQGGAPAHQHGDMSEEEDMEMDMDH